MPKLDPLILPIVADDKKADAAFRRINKSARGAQQSARKTKQTFGSIFSTQLPTLINPTTIAITGVSIAATQMLQAVSELQKAQISYETILGDPDRAKRVLKELNDLALESPFFGIQTLRTQGKQLLAVGVGASELTDTLKTLGDIAAGVDVPLSRLALNYGQVLAQGKLTGRELRDFAVAGVPLVSELAKQLNVADKEIFDMVSRGEIGFAQVKQALEGMTTEGGRFNNLMSRMGETLPGKLSKIADNLVLIGERLGSAFAGPAGGLLNTVDKITQIFAEGTGAEILRMMNSPQSINATIAGITARNSRDSLLSFGRARRNDIRKTGQNFQGLDDIDFQKLVNDAKKPGGSDALKELGRLRKEYEKIVEQQRKSAEIAKQRAAEQREISFQNELSKSGLPDDEIGSLDDFGERSPRQSSFFEFTQIRDAAQFRQEMAEQALEIEEAYYESLGELADNELDRELDRQESIKQARMAAIEGAMAMGQRLMIASDGQSRVIFNIAKGLAIGQTIMHTQTAVMAAIAEGPWGWIKVPLVIAEGALRLANINRVKYNSGQTLGTLPGGAGTSGTGLQGVTPAIPDNQTIIGMQSEVARAIQEDLNQQLVNEVKGLRKEMKALVGKT